jgi:hypothetical protein
MARLTSHYWDVWVDYGSVVAMSKKGPGGCLGEGEQGYTLYYHPILPCPPAPRCCRSSTLFILRQLPVLGTTGFVQSTFVLLVEIQH